MNAFLYGSGSDANYLAAGIAGHLCGGSEIVVFTASELAPGENSFAYSFTKGITPRARNQMAAMICRAVVVCGKPKYYYAVVREFRARGRRVFWFNGHVLREVEAAPNVVTGLHNMHGEGEGMREEDLWAEQALQKRAEMDALFLGEVGSVTKCNACSICGFRRTCENKMPQIKRHIHRNGISPRGLNGIPTYGWSEPVNDVDCSEEDVLHPRNQRVSDVDAFEVRRKEVMGF